MEVTIYTQTANTRVVPVSTLSIKTPIEPSELQGLVSNTHYA